LDGEKISNLEAKKTLHNSMHAILHKISYDIAVLAS